MSTYFEFTNPTKLCSGTGAADNIAYELKMLGARKPMVLSDGVLEKIGTLSIVLNALGDLPVGRVFTEIPRDSSIDTVNRIAEEYRDYGCDSLLAVGGGSVLDTAKGVRLLISQKADDLKTLMGCESIPRGAHIPFVAVPTTAGTGSEATAVAVIKDTKAHVKMEYISTELMPDVAVE